MHSQRHRTSPGTEAVGAADSDAVRTAIEAVVIRNHDQERAYTCQVTVRDHEGDRICDRTISVDPAATASLELTLGRGVYRVEALHDAGGSGCADCLIGGDPAELVTIETGNGALSLRDGSSRF